jgi:hypothetical protein
MQGAHPTYAVDWGYRSVPNQYCLPWPRTREPLNTFYPMAHTGLEFGAWATLCKPLFNHDEAF